MEEEEEIEVQQEQEEGEEEQGQVQEAAGMVQLTASAAATAAASCRLLPLLQQLLAVARQINHRQTTNQHPLTNDQPMSTKTNL